MQERNIELMSCLESLPEAYHSLPFHEYFAKTIPISALNKEAEAILWHQRLIHCGSHSLKSASLYEKRSSVPMPEGEGGQAARVCGIAYTISA